MAEQLDATTRITKARIRTMVKEPFFGSLLLGLDMEEVRWCETAATDGVRIVYNPDFINTLSDPELDMVLAHEVLHVVFKHHLRRQKRDPEQWNVAGDFAINLVLKDCGYTLPKDVLFDPQYKDLSTEAIYDRLPPPPPKGGKQGGPGDGGQGQGQPVYDPSRLGGVMDQPAPDGKEMGQEQAKAEEMRVDAKVAQAAMAAKARGKLPGSLQGFIHDVLHPKLDWREVLRRFVQETMNPSDFTWSRPNRRALADGMYLPGTLKEAVGEIVVVGDSSGSVSDHELAQFFGEMGSIVEEVKPERTHIIMCDSAIGWTGTFEAGDELDYKVIRMGRGGTSFAPPFDWVRKNDIHPKALIYLTDLECSFPKEPDYPVLWISTTKRKAPWGETIQL